MKPLLLAIDQGTTNTKAVLVSETGKAVARGNAPVPIRHPRPGWVEQDGEEIWRSVLAAAADCVAGRESEIAAIGVSNQRESILAWDAKSGKPVGPCVTWQCRRAVEICERVRRRGGEDEIRAKTGLPLDPLFSAGKARWLAERAQCAPSDLRLGTVDSWLLWNLSGKKRHACDESNASRTQLLDIENGKWDEGLCEMFGAPRRSLPEVLPSDGEFGLSSGAAPIPDGIPIRGMIGDSHAALFGHGIIAPGAVKATYGTGSSLMTLLPESAQDAGGKVAKTVAWNLGGERRFALEGNILVSASALPWAAEWMGLGGDPGKLAELAKTVADTAGAHFVPALVGLGAPHWDSRARGLLCGLTFNAGPAHLARAVIESIAWQVCDVYDEMAKESKSPSDALFADGGPSANDWLMQLQADFLGRAVWQCEAADVSALGAAGIAGIAIGLWPDSRAFSDLPRNRRKITPTMNPRRRRALRAGWREATARALFCPAPK